jgi:2-amino-4,5-dihydroxy-6-oxo-7-(phosphooxy)heptanoate synthase
VQLNDSFARRLRMRHLYRHDPDGLLVVPLDHAVGSGPFGPAADLDRLVAQIADNGADAVIVHKGAVRRIRPERFRDLALLVHLNAGTCRSADPDARHPVATVEEALRLGAHGVSVHVNVGSRTGDQQIADLAAVAGDCERWGLPLLAMMYARGPAVSDGRAPALVAHAAVIAAELGADLVKTALPDSAAGVAGVVGGCPVPVLAAGGPVTASGEDLRRLADAVRAGAGGIAAGRLVFTAADPGAMVRRLSALVHGRAPVPAR